MDDIFRSFFGFPNRKDSRSRLPDDSEAFEDPHQTENDDHDIHGAVPFGNSDLFMFTHPDDIFRQFDDMFAKFDNIFRGFGMPFEMPSVDRGPGEGNIFPALPPAEDREITPRDKMLKRPDLLPPGDARTDDSSRGFFGRLWSHPTWDRRTEIKQDEDVDDSVRSSGLNSLFDDEEARMMKRPSLPSHHSAFQSVSVHTYRGPDGKVEERRTMVDGRGNEQTIVTRSMDGRTVRQTTKRNKNGEQEVIEDLINMDEKDKDSFEEKWRIPKSHSKSLDMLPRNDVLREHDTDISDLSLFKKLFGFKFPGQN
jgi:hypothetical protein